jgi:photosystem II stability/assembly factor-like uncharacterized protein
MTKSILFFLLFSITGTAYSLLQAQENSPATGFDSFIYRNLGAFRAGAWVGSIAVPENPGEKYKYTFYVGPRNGGVWKTINNGTTFECITDEIGVTSVGDIAVAPSNPEVIWTGTGEAFNARLSTSGNGIWKSEDAGKTWKNMGLKDSHHIAKIVIHPSNQNTVWVASMGHLFSRNEERGIFRTTDGGKTWTRVLYVDDSTGFIDLVINSNNPDILYAASYEKTRTGWTYEPGGEKSRIYKTIDGGRTWKVLGGGLPQGPLGRIGIDIHRANPEILVAVVQNLNVKPGADLSKTAPFDPFTDHSFDNLIGGEVYRSNDGGNSWKRINDPAKTDVSGKAGYSFNKINIDPVDPDKIYIIGAGMYYTLDGGKTWPSGRQQELFQTNFGDNRSFWIDPKDPRHIMLGSDGGIYSTWDGGRSMNYYYQIPLGEVYQVEVDNAIPYNLYIGLQDHETWKGPSNSWSGEVNAADWTIVGMWDGMYCKVDPEDNKWLYFTTQFGAHHRENQQTGERIPIAPQAAPGEDYYRYTWTTPLALSPHNSSIIYTGGQKLLRSLDRGNTWEAISPDLTDNDPVKRAGKGHIRYCSISTISESPLKAGVIWVGTDDGHVHLTRDFGHTWEEMTAKLTSLGAPSDRWVSRVFSSSHQQGTAYVTKSGFTFDDPKPYVYKTTDFGKSWVSISSNLPDQPVNVIYEDKKNPDLLFVGNENGVYVSLNGGSSWDPFKVNMPPVPVKDLLVHPRENDLVAGTYGRGVWITDVSPLQQFTKAVRDSGMYLFDIDPKPQINYSQQATWGNYQMTGSNQLRTPNEQNGMELWYYFSTEDKSNATIRINDESGKKIYEKSIAVKKGIGKIFWNTEQAYPGRYTVILSEKQRSVEKKGVVTGRWIWPVLNWR